jgi:tRNA(His) 5'-end guanylyltransferase
MKAYEDMSKISLLPRLPVIARLDGRSFSKFTHGMDKPYDKYFMAAMQELTRFLVSKTHANIGYTQSDEVSLTWYNPDGLVSGDGVFFNGKVQKTVSVLASMAAARFQAMVLKHWPEKESLFPHFDCRVFTVPSPEEGANAFLWREMDATRNAIQSAGQRYFSHKQLMHRKLADIQEMLFQHENINFNDYPADFKRGSWFRRKAFTVQLDRTTLYNIPAEHRPVGGLVQRTDVQQLDMPPFKTVTNRVGVIFRREIPTTILAEGDYRSDRNDR